MIGKRVSLFMFTLLLSLATFMVYNPVSGIPTKAKAEEPTTDEVDTAIMDAKYLIENVKGLVPEEGEDAVEQATKKVEKAQWLRDSGELESALENANEAIEELNKLQLNQGS